MTELIDKARSLAKKVHDGQWDKLGVAYMEHVEAVAAEVASLGENFTIVALLHDTVEDTDDPTLVNLGMIADMFGDNIAQAVDAMTKRSGEAYATYLARVSANPIAKPVKLADVAHNMSRLSMLTDVATRERLLQKYQRAQRTLKPL